MACQFNLTVLVVGLRFPGRKLAWVYRLERRLEGSLAAVGSLGHIGKFRYVVENEVRVI